MVLFELVIHFMETTSEHSMSYSNRSKNTLYILIAIVVVLSGLYFVLIKKDKIEPYTVESRYAELLKFKNTGEPVSTPDERYDALGDNTDKGTIQMTKTEKLQALELLNNKSK